MPGLASVALNTAPIFGGVLLAAAAGQLKGPDTRNTIKQDLDLIDRLPADQEVRRAALQRTVEERIDDLVATNDRNRALRAAVSSYQGGWRDFVLFACVALFTYIWWNVDHQRDNWLPMFVVLILASVVTAAHAVVGMWKGLTTLMSRDSGQ